MTLTLQDAPSTTPNRFARNSEVYLTEQCTADNPLWLKQAQLRASDVVNKIPFKVKSILARGVNVWYTLERNGVSIFNVPEEYLKESKSDFPAGYMKKEFAKPEPQVGQHISVEIGGGVTEICKIVNVGTWLTVQRRNGQTFDMRKDAELVYIDFNTKAIGQKSEHNEHNEPSQEVNNIVEEVVEEQKEKIVEPKPIDIKPTKKSWFGKKK